MKTHNLLILIVVGIILSVAAVKIHNGKQAPSSGSVKGENGLSRGDVLITSLDDASMTRVAKVEVTKDGKTIVLQSDDDKTWSAASVGGFPADPAKVKALVLNLRDFVVSSRLTGKEDKYLNFGLENEIGSGGKIVLSDKDGAQIASLICGDARDSAGAMSPNPMRPPPSGGGGRYYRQGSDPYVYLAQDKLPSVDPSVKAWVDTKIAAVEADKIIALTIDHATTEALTLNWKSGSAETDNLDEGLELKEYEVNNVRGAMSNLTLDDVLPAASPTAAGLEFATTYTATAKDGTIYSVQVAEAATKHYIKMSAEYGEIFLSAEDSASTVTLAEAQIAAQTAEKALPEFNAKHTPWVYELSSWSAGKFTKMRSEMTQPKPEPEPTPAPAPPAATPGMPPIAPGAFPGGMMPPKGAVGE